MASLVQIVRFAVVGALLAAVPRPAQAGKGNCQYTVKKGDTVSRIARRKGVSEKNLIRANPALKKNPNRVRVGQKLEICKAKRLQQSKPSKCGKSGRLVNHKVSKGETLGGIAARYNTSRDRLRKYNPRIAKRKNSMIRVGENVRVCTTSRKYTHRSWLKDGVQLPEGEGYNIRRPHNAWGTQLAVDGIVAALAEYHRRQPEAPLVQVGDISRQNGGPLRDHMSHQEGRDVDIGVVWAQAEGEEERRHVDIARTWALLESFVDSPDVKVIFIDYGLQKKLYKHAESLGVDEARLAEIFQYPRTDGDAILYHWPGHRLHFHVRFRRPGKDEDETETETEDSDDEAQQPSAAS